MNCFALRFALYVSALHSFSIHSGPKRVTFADHAEVRKLTDPFHPTNKGKKNPRHSKDREDDPLPVKQYTPKTDNTTPSIVKSYPLAQPDTTKLPSHFQRRLQILKEVSQWQPEEVLDKINERLNELTKEPDASVQAEIELFKHLKCLEIALKIESIDESNPQPMSNFRASPTQIESLHALIVDLENSFKNQSVEDAKQYTNITDQCNQIRARFQSNYKKYEATYTLKMYQENTPEQDLFNFLDPNTGWTEDCSNATHLYPHLCKMTDSELEKYCTSLVFFKEHSALVKQLLQCPQEYAELLQSSLNALRCEWDEWMEVSRSRFSAKHALCTAITECDQLKRASQFVTLGAKRWSKDKVVSQFATRKLPYNTKLTDLCANYLREINEKLRTTSQGAQIAIETFKTKSRDIQNYTIKLLYEIFFPPSIEVQSNVNCIEHKDSNSAGTTVTQEPTMRICGPDSRTSTRTPNTSTPHPSPISPSTPSTTATAPSRAQPSARLLPPAPSFYTSPSPSLSTPPTTDASAAPTDAPALTSSKPETISTERIIFTLSIIPLLVFLYLIYKKYQRSNSQI